MKLEDSLVACGIKVGINYNLKCKYHGNNFDKLFYDQSKVVYVEFIKLTDTDIG